MKKTVFLLLVLLILLTGCQSPEGETTAAPPETEAAAVSDKPGQSGAVTGSVAIEGGLEQTGDIAGATTFINVDFTASSALGAVTEMRAVSNYGEGCPDEVEVDRAAWEPFQGRKEFQEVAREGFYDLFVSAQFRDSQGNISEIYCDEIQVEGLLLEGEPAGPPDLESFLASAGQPITKLPNGADVIISEIHMQDRSTGWALGGEEDPGGHVLRTSDGGQTWRDVTPPEPQPDEGQTRKIAHAFFLDAQHAWVAFSHEAFFELPNPVIIWATADGGGTWTPATPARGIGGAEFFTPSLFYFVDESSGWLFASVGAGMSHDYTMGFRTQDGGGAWEQIIDPSANPYLQICAKTGISFADNLAGWVTRDCMGLVPGAMVDLTRDGGQTWAEMPLPPPPLSDPGELGSDFCGAFSPQLTSENEGQLVVQCVTDFGPPREIEAFFYATQDGGESWSVLPFPARTAAYLNGAEMWGLGREIYFSDDGGAGWAFVKEVFWDGQFSFVDGQYGWAVARSDGEVALVYTTDAGETWLEIAAVVGN